MIHERRKNALIQRQTGTRVPEWNSGENAICCWYIEVFRIVWVEASTSEDQSGQELGFQPRCLLLREAYVIEYWELRPKGRTVLIALIQCISRDRSWFGGQCSRGRILVCVSKLCALELKWRWMDQVLFLFSFAADLWWPK